MSEDRLVKFKFEDETHTRSLPWNVLLTTDESVFLSYEDVEVGSQVLAPWTDGSTKKVQYAKAVIVGDDDWSEGTLKFGVLMYSYLLFGRSMFSLALSLLALFFIGPTFLCTAS